MARPMGARVTHLLREYRDQENQFHLSGQGGVTNGVVQSDVGDLSDTSLTHTMEHFLLKQIRTVTTNIPFQIGGSVTNVSDTGFDWCTGDCKC